MGKHQKFYFCKLEGVPQLLVVDFPDAVCSVGKYEVCFSIALLLVHCTPITNYDINKKFLHFYLILV